MVSDEREHKPSLCFSPPIKLDQVEIKFWVGSTDEKAMNPRRKRYSEEQIIGILKEAETGVSAADLCRKYGMSQPSFYKWKSKFGGMEVSDAKKLRGLEEENRKLKTMVADLMLDQKVLKELLSKNF